MYSLARRLDFGRRLRGAHTSVGSSEWKRGGDTGVDRTVPFHSTEMVPLPPGGAARKQVGQCHAVPTTAGGRRYLPGPREGLLPTRAEPRLPGFGEPQGE